MQTVIRFIHEHYYDIFIPLTALALLRLAMCFAQLKRTAAIRRKKGVYHSVRDAYAEIGAWLGMLPFLALALAVPAFWPEKGSGDRRHLPRGGPGAEARGGGRSRAGGGVPHAGQRYGRHRRRRRDTLRNGKHRR